ncbi:MAG: hypothetical protein DRH23_05210 [Deltaproteobacteria bacterium]|nr:MAG: hypothetical protein DRH23_05210 [Deltaproteobacteria bacterium]
MSRESLLDEILRPPPTPAGLTSRDLVRKSIAFDSPARFPYSFVDPVQSDFFETALLRWRGYFDRGESLATETRYLDDWNVQREVSSGLFDRTLTHPLRDLSQLEKYSYPDLAAPEHYQVYASLFARAQDAGKYIVAADPVLLFERIRDLMGFEAMLVAPLEQRSGFESLLDRLTDLTIACLDQYADAGEVDAFMTWQDFGAQSGLIVSLDVFREFFQPRLVRIIDAAHRRGMHFIWHCCGEISSLIPEAITMGVDVLQLDQPRVIGHAALAELCAGRMCLWNCVDTIWSSSPDLSVGALDAEIEAMTDAFRGGNGGFMARHYPQPEDILLPDFFHPASRRAFLKYGAAIADEC